MATQKIKKRAKKQYGEFPLRHNALGPYLIFTSTKSTSTSQRRTIESISLVTRRQINRTENNKTRRGSYPSLPMEAVLILPGPHKRRSKRHTVSLSGIQFVEWAKERERNRKSIEIRERRIMATVGGVREVAGIENSVQIDNLARFAVEEHNKKEVSLFLF